MVKFWPTEQKEVTDEEAIIRQQRKSGFLRIHREEALKMSMVADANAYQLKLDEM